MAAAIFEITFFGHFERIHIPMYLQRFFTMHFIKVANLVNHKVVALEQKIEWYQNRCFRNTIVEHCAFRNTL